MGSVCFRLKLCIWEVLAKTIQPHLRATGGKQSALACLKSKAKRTQRGRRHAGLRGREGARLGSVRGAGVRGSGCAPVLPPGTAFAPFQDGWSEPGLPCPRISGCWCLGGLWGLQGLHLLPCPCAAAVQLPGGPTPPWGWCEGFRGLCSGNCSCPTLQWWK